MIVFLNCKDELRVLDPFSLEEVESVNIKSTGLVYHTEFMSKSNGVEESHIPGKVPSTMLLECASGRVLLFCRVFASLSVH